MLQELQAPINLSVVNQKTYDESQVSRSRSSPYMGALLSNMAKLYAEVFADPPWNEYKVCDKEHYTSKINGNLTVCAICNGELRPAYPEVEVIQKILSAAGNVNGACLTVFEDAEGNTQAVGWGFVCTNQELQKFYQSEEMRNLVEKNVATYTQQDKIFYISEVFVAKVAQNKGLGTQVAKTLVNRARELKLNIALRTHNESPMASIAGIKLGMDRIVNVGEDKDYEGRILFAKKL